MRRFTALVSVMALAALAFIMPAHAQTPRSGGELIFVVPSLLKSPLPSTLPLPATLSPVSLVMDTVTCIFFFVRML